MSNAVKLKFLCLLVCIFSITPLSLPIHAQSTACNLEAVVTKAISGVPMLEWEDATENSVGGQLKAAAALGEFEPGSIVVRKKNGSCTNVKFSMDDFALSGDSSQTISKNNIQIKYVKKWFQGGTAWVSIGSDNTRKLTPELLLNNPRLVKVDLSAKRNYLIVNNGTKAEYTDISAYSQKNVREAPGIDKVDIRDEKTLQPIDFDKESQQIFVTFFAPAGARPGEYRSTLHISRDQIDLVTIPVIFEVLPFTLDAPAIEYSIFYRGQLTNGIGTISSESKNEEQYRADLLDMLQHGVSNPNIYQSFDSKALLKKALEIRREVGFNNRAIYYLGKSASVAQTDVARADLSASITVLRQIGQPLGYAELYIFGKDEAKGLALHQQLPSWQFVRSTLGQKVFTTGYKGTFDSVGAQLDLLILAGEPNPDEIKKFHDANKRVMTYAYPQSGPENPELFRRNFGINLWALGSDGAMTYAYQDSFGFIWNDFDHEEYRDHNFVYPTSDGVIDTIAWEGFREAVDDVRYLTTLKNRIGKLKGACTSQQCIDALAESSSIFDAIKQKSSNRDLDGTRKQIAQAIQKLQPFIGPLTAPTPPEIRVTHEPNK
jgi:hypothetical protein